MSIQSNHRLLGLALVASLSASALAAGPVAAQAQDTGAGLAVSVRYSDLDINREAGARVMLKRIQWAASEACGGEPDLRVLERRMIYDRCRSQTIERAVTALNAPLVTAAAHGSATPAYAGR